MSLSFNDFQKQNIKFDIYKLKEAYKQVLKIKDFQGVEGVTNFGAISLTQIPGDPDSIKGNKARGVFWTKPDQTGKEVIRDQMIDEAAYSEFISDYKVKLARALVIIITTIDPDAIVFGGGVSNEIDFLDEIKQITSKFINEPNLKTIFLKPLYGDASGVRGAALLGRENFI